jgi:hypothetical protein
MVLLPKDIDVSKISVSKPTVLDNGAKKIFVNYEGQKYFRIQTPKMGMPFGMSEYSEGPYPKYSAMLSFKEAPEDRPKNIKYNEKIRQFHDKLLEIENRLIELAVENGTSWFKMPKNKINHEIIASKFTPMVKVSCNKEGEPDGKYPPTTKVKIYRSSEGKFNIKLFDMNDNNRPIDVNSSDDLDINDVLGKHAQIKGIINCVAIWIGSGSFMCQWALSEARVEIPEAYKPRESFLPDSDDEEGEAEEDDENRTNEPTHIEDSDEEVNEEKQDGDEDEADDASGSDAEEEREPTPEPVKKPAPKKVLKKKKAT